MATPAQPESSSRQPKAEEPGARMSFFEHLAELRTRLINSLLAIGAGMVLGLLASQKVINFISMPMMAALRSAHLDDHMIYTSPVGYIAAYINLGLYLGIVLAMPYVLYQLWLFVAPGLYKHERRAVSAFVVSSTALFICGIAFAYFVMVPQVLQFLVDFALKGPVRPLISFNEYFDFLLVVLLGLGLIFEMPVLIFILSLFGIVTPKFLLRNFRYALLVITIVAAVVTPTPDATTMLLFMAPMVALYFVGVFVSYAVVRRKRAQALAQGEAR
jgi:sec-independent protein translocase protein TatC